MRIWSLHPAYLDARGLVALWRETLLAQAVLRGRTRGYRNHPQLLRFSRSPHPLGAIAAYLRAVHRQAVERGYSFDGSRIGGSRFEGTLTVTRGQVDHELAHLRAKLAGRDRQTLRRLEGLVRPRTHPLFRVVPGPVEEWERS